MGQPGTAVVVKTGNEFAIKFSRIISFSGTENVFSSPYSLRVALGMCSAGAVGETKKVMVRVLGTPELPEEQNAIFGKVVKEINGDGSPREYELRTANALWRDQTCQCLEKYKADIATYYGGDCNGVDFVKESSKAVVIINDWVSHKTDGKIKDLVNDNIVNKETRLVLINAIYFKGKWESAFKKEYTSNEIFFVSTRESIQALMMKQKSRYAYYEDEKVQVVDIPYKGDDLSMLVVLPQDKDGLAAVEDVWNEYHYNTVISHMHTEEVQVYLPKFKMETKYELKSILSDMGLSLCFSDGADFSGISATEALKISEVVHKAFVAVDEEGTEAAAATAVGFKCMVAMPTRPKIFNANHPFMFFIRNRKTGTILFSGHLKNPTN